MQPKRRIEARAWRDFIVPAQIVEAERDREFPAVLPSADRGAMRTSGSVRQYLVRATVRRVSPSSITAVDAGAVYERACIERAYGMMGLLRSLDCSAPIISSGPWLFSWQMYSNNSGPEVHWSEKPVVQGAV